MFERILIPIDASDESLLALAPARRLARADGAQLCILRIALAHEVAAAGALPALVRAVRQIVDTPNAAGAVTRDEAVIRQVEHASEIPAMIVAEARAREADLIVMATHARSGLDRLAHPSVAEAVLANAPAPLLLVGAPPERAGGASDPVLVAVDGTPEGAVAITVAAQYARALGAELLLLRVVPPELVDEGASALRYDQDALADAQHYLERLVARLSDCGIPAQGRAMFGPVAETIAAVAEQVHAAAIALSTHHLRGMARLVHGSIADDLLRAEICPILLARRDADSAAWSPAPDRDVPGVRPRTASRAGQPA